MDPTGSCSLTLWGYFQLFLWPPAFYRTLVFMVTKPDVFEGDLWIIQPFLWWQENHHNPNHHVFLPWPFLYLNQTRAEAQSCDERTEQPKHHSSAGESPAGYDAAHHLHDWESNRQPKQCPVSRKNIRCDPLRRRLNTPDLTSPASALMTNSSRDILLHRVLLLVI